MHGEAEHAGGPRRRERHGSERGGSIGPLLALRVEPEGVALRPDPLRWSFVGQKQAHPASVWRQTGRSGGQTPPQSPAASG